MKFGGWSVAAILAVLALNFAALALRPPEPAPVSAGPKVFSAARAMADVRAIAQKPHAFASPELGRVQTLVESRMGELGLAPQRREFQAKGLAGRNLLGVLPGQDRAAPAVMLMAHADSVPAGPGAADDGAGVAAVLETVRALKAAGPLRRDVMVLITDGEEAGLLGAESFFSADPSRSRVGVVINLEARGNRGRAVMFETHRGAAPMIAFLTHAGGLAAASSLMPDLYRRLPNDTDLTEAVQRGYAGLNFAFFSGLQAYHRAADNPDSLDPGSLQHIGEQALRAASALASAPALPGRAPDRAYADVMGGPVLQYPAVVGWALVLISGAAVAVWALKAAREGRLTRAGAAGGVLAFLLLLVLLAAAFWALGEIRVLAAGRHMAPLLRRQEMALAGAGLVAFGACLGWFALAARRLDSAALQLGALTLLFAAALAVQALAPLDAFLFAWPLLLLTLGLTLAGSAGPWACYLSALAVLMQVFYWAGLMFDLVGQTTPAALVPFAAVAAAAILSVAPPRAGRREAAVALGGAGLGLALALAALLP